MFSIFIESEKEKNLDGILLFFLSIFIYFFISYKPIEGMFPVLEGSISFKNQNNNSTMDALHLDRDSVSSLEKYGIINFTIHEENIPNLGYLYIS